MQLFSAKCHSRVRLDGKTAIVTGCNTGIGKETVQSFYERGARVIMACRDIKKAENAKADIQRITSGKINVGKIVVKKLDLASLKSVKEFSDLVLKEERRIDILVNNAGVMVCPQGKTEDGFETHMGTNHLGHFLLTLLLLPKIISSPSARIVTVSSVAHKYSSLDFDDPNYERKTYWAWPAYFKSKLANVLFSKELSRKLKERGIDNVTCYSLHPGVIATDLQRHLDSLFFRGVFTLWNYTGALFSKTPKQGAQTTIYCSIDEKCANETGLYYAECAVRKPQDDAESEEIAERLWEWSIKAVKLEGYDPFTIEKNTSASPGKI